MTADVRVVSTRMLRLLERDSHQLDQGPPPFLRQGISAEATNGLDPDGLHIIMACYVTASKHLRAFCAVSVLPKLKLPGNTEYAVIDIRESRYISLRPYDEAITGLTDEGRAVLESRYVALQARFRPSPKQHREPQVSAA